MYFFMTAIYCLTFASVLGLTLTGLQGYFGFLILGANHPTFGFFTAIIYLFTEVLVMFFFVGTGVSIRDYVHAHSLEQTFHLRSTALKRKLYPPTLLNVVLVMVVFILGGAVDTNLIPSWVHGLLFFAALIHFGFTIKGQHACFKENTRIILEMTGINRN